MILWTHRTSFVNRFFGGTKTREVGVSAQRVIAGNVSVNFSDRGEWTATSFWFWKRVQFSRDGVQICDFILDDTTAVGFLENVALGQLGVRSHGAVQAVLAIKPRWLELTSGRRYVPRHEAVAFADSVRPLVAAVPSAITPLLEADRSTGWQNLINQLKEAFGHIARANDAFVAAEQIRLKPWFERMDRLPTQAQREIAIRDETNFLVVAGAGTGKTSTILTKVAYLVHSRLAAAENILVVAFNRDAAEEIRDRCRKKGIEGISIYTFHALGLAVLGQAEGSKPAVLSQLESDQGRDELVAKLLADLCTTAEFAENYARFVLLYARPSFSPSDAQSKEQHVRHTKAFITKSIQGDWVRSTEELRIANWLFAHGIRYSYETAYGRELKTPTRRQYRPDFTITITVKSAEGVETEKTIYLEHQALDESGNPPPWMKVYSDKVRWVRSTHQAQGTVLVESFSWWFRKGSWEERLASALSGAGVPIGPVDWRAVLRAAEEKKECAIEWERKTVLGLFRRAIDLVRTTTSGSDSGNEFLCSALGYSASGAPLGVDVSRTALFDSLFIPLYHRYEEFKRSNGGVDFEDMIFRARQHVERGEFQARWSHYIVDEFQDASRSRLQLITAMRKQRADSRLLCVGDDWQSIIRFAGSDIRVMTHFEQMVGPFWRCDLDLTFRSSANITSLARDFVLKNPNQLKKNVRPAAGRRDLPIRILFRPPAAFGSEGDQDTARFSDVLSEELTRISQEFERASVLVLSRYRRGVPEPAEQRTIRANFPTLTISWSTAHASKGREADAVIIGDLDDSPFGFPCLREDDPLIVRLLPPEDSFPCSEERRLFYVAMTRAKERLVLVANDQQPSPFVLELLKQRQDSSGLDVVRGAETVLKTCPACGVGIIVARDGVNGRFYSCTKSPVCSHTEEACPSCRNGFLMEQDGGFVCSNHGCDHRARMCPRCRRGWLETKTNRKDGTTFLGCSRYRDEEAPCTHTEDLFPRSRRQRRW